MTIQPAGHTFGPRVPHVGFWCGDTFLGETRYPFTEKDHATAINVASARIRNSIEMLNPGPNGSALLSKLNSRYCAVKIYY